MKKSLGLALMLALGCVLGALFSSNEAGAQKTPPQEHFKQLRFSLAPGELSPPIELPVKNAPVRLELVTGEIHEFFNGQVYLNSPFVVTTVITYDGAGGHLGGVAPISPEGQIFVRIGFKMDQVRLDQNNVVFTAIRAGSFSTGAVSDPFVTYTLNLWY